MNLVKIAEDLKGVPLQALQAYVNGQNPEVPPYVAAAEMQRRQAEMQRAQIAQGAAQANAPSVKDQLEQAVGLMSLQQQRQQQAVQQVAQQGQMQPMPTSEATPQPQGMARGGIAKLPVGNEMFEYAGGGIIGYQAGGKTYYDPNFGRPEAARLAGRRDQKLLELQDELQSLLDAKDRYQRANSDTRGIDQAIANTRLKIQEATAGAETGIENLRIQGSGMAGITDQPPAVPTPKAPAAAAGIASVAPDQMAAENRRIASSNLAGITDQPPAVPTPTPGQQSRSTAAPESSDQAQPQEPSLQEEAIGVIGEYMRTKPKEYTPEMAGETEGKLYKQSGLAGLEAERAKMREMYEATKKDRPIDTAIATLAGGARGYGGVASGYLGAKRAQEKRDLGFAADMYEREAAPAEKRYGAQGKLLSEGVADTEAARQRQLTAATSIAGEKGRTPQTETERLMAEVRQLRTQNRHAEAQALIDLNRTLRFAGPNEMTPDQVKKMAFEAANAALKNGEIDRAGMQKFVEDYMAAWGSINQPAQQPSGGTTPTGTTMPSSPKALADQLKKQLGR